VTDPFSGEASDSLTITCDPERGFTINDDPIEAATPILGCNSGELALEIT